MSDPQAPDQPDATRWEVPSIDGTPGPGYLTASRLQELQKQAYDEAYKDGLEAGQKAGEEAVRERAARFDQLLVSLNKPFDARRTITTSTVNSRRRSWPFPD